MEFEKIIRETGGFYWTWRDRDFYPYAWLEKKDLKELPLPFYLQDIHPACEIGFEATEKDEVTNIIELPETFSELKLNNDLRKDLRRVESKNSETKILFNEKNSLEKSKHWFLEQWNENKKDFDRRMPLWKKISYTQSAYIGKELAGVHIAMEENKIIYYFGCWWNREYKNLSIPTFLLKKDIEKAIEKKMKYYDLEVGDETYKKKWGVIEKPTKYYAVLTKQLAEKMKIEKFIEIKESEFNY